MKQKLAPVNHIYNNNFKALTQFISAKKYNTYFILCDENSLQYCAPLLIQNCRLLADAEIIEIESGEENKVLEIAANIWQTLIELNADKTTLLINLGGGVISDLGGFVASTYKRGIDFVNIPTTVLAMADASIGGKNGIDFFEIKNVIGSINQPKAIFINKNFLNTLPIRQYKNGLAEIYKIALVFDKKLWSELNEGLVDSIIERSIALKEKIVATDLNDNTKRKILNFGHTIGHAIESYFLKTKTTLLHGEAVVIGMLLESHIALQKKLVTKNIFEQIESVLCTHFQILISEKLEYEKLKPFLLNDKKNYNSKIKMALINGIGSCKYDTDVTEQQIIKAINYFEGNASTRN